MLIESESDMEVICEAESGEEGIKVFSINWTTVINRLTDDVHDTPKRAGPNRHQDRRPCIGDLLATNEPLGGVHGDTPHGAFPEML